MAELVSVPAVRTPQSMQASDVIAPGRIEAAAPASSRKRVLELLGALLARDAGLPPQVVYESLMSREKLGSTAIGHGVAIPHGRLKDNRQTLAAFVRLGEGVDFDAADRGKVDLLFALLVPEESTEEHLELLAQLARMFSDDTFRQQLRQANSNDQIHQLLLARSRNVA